jgi:hypothetical protein
MARAEEKFFRSPCLECWRVEELASMLVTLKRRPRDRVMRARGNRGRAGKGTSPYYSLYEGRR